MLESLKKLIAIAVAAALAVKKYIETNAAQAQQIEDLTKSLGEKDAIITDLRTQLENAGATQEALAAAKQRADEAEARSTELQSRQDAIDSQKEEADAATANLASLLEEHPNTPTVDPATFKVVEEGDPVAETPAQG